MTTVQEEVLGLWSSLSPMGEFVECGDTSPHGSESGDESPHSPLGGLNDDQGPNPKAGRMPVITPKLWCFKLFKSSYTAFSISSSYLLNVHPCR